jgi:hypothetical protein
MAQRLAAWTKFRLKGSPERPPQYLWLRDHPNLAGLGLLQGRWDMLEEPPRHIVTFSLGILEDVEVCTDERITQPREEERV